MKVAILGAGAYGTALGKTLADNGLDVCLWGHTSSLCDEINEKHSNSRFLPGIALPQNLRAEKDPHIVVKECDALIIAVPSLYLLDSIKCILDCENIREGVVKIAAVTKGFIRRNGIVELCNQVLENYLPGSYKGNTVYISGPSHAEEVARNKITALMSASENLRNAIFFRNLFNTSNVRLFPSLDIVGVQICASIKNVIAIAFGILDALAETSEKVGDNTEAFLFAAGLNEIQTFGSFMGASHSETFTSIAGVGDLDVTCRSLYGRNRRFGREIILKNILKDYQDIEDLMSNVQKLDYLPEGIFATYYAYELIAKESLKLPIILSVYQILNKEIKGEEAIQKFL